MKLKVSIASKMKTYNSFLHVLRYCKEKVDPSSSKSQVELSSYGHLFNTMGPVTTGGNRQVLHDHQGITEHVPWRFVLNGFPFGFLRTVLMFMSTFNMLGIT